MRTTQLLRLLIAFLFLALSISVYFNFRQKELTPPTPNSKSKNEVCSDYSNETPATLDTEVISDLVEQYRNNQLRVIDATMSNPDAHSVWFDLETLKKFIYHIEVNVNQNAPTNNNQLGLRLYYGAYPDKNDFASKVDLSTVNQAYEYKHTVVMIPTIDKPGVGAVDFNPLYTNTYDGYISQKKNIEVINSSVLLAEYQAANYQPMALTNTRVVSRNHGSLIPPGSRIVEGF